jgi:hypothetical protein
MKTFTNRLARVTPLVTMIAALLAAGFTAQGARADQAVPAKAGEARVIQLPTVVIVAKRIPVIQLERVVVIGHRLPAATLVAQRAPRGTSAKSGERV